MSGQAEDTRALALRLIRAVLRLGRRLDEAMAENPGLARHSARDRAFVRLLCATVLRRLGQIDALIDHCLERPLKPKLAEIRDLLRLGTAQLLFLRTPAHAAISTTVALAESPRLAGHKGLINAVLRRLAREGPGLVAAQDAARLNTPPWLWRSWSAAYGEAAAGAVARAHLIEPPLDLTLKDAGGDWAARLGAQVLPTGSLRLAAGAGEVAKLPGYDSGAWWVQDAAATLPARLFGQIRGRRVIDLCAAPGGKTAELAAAGARVTAVEISPGRGARLRENLSRLDLAAQVVIADARVWRPARRAEAVLLDAPCSATGALRRHPDIARLKRRADIAPLTRLQDSLLAAALEMLAPGGLLVYAVCSLQPEEGPARIAALLGSGVPLRRVPVRCGEIGGLAEAISPAGDLRTLPCHLGDSGGMDGFYACRLRRDGDA